MRVLITGFHCANVVSRDGCLCTQRHHACHASYSGTVCCDCMNCSVLALRRLDACDALFDPCKAGCMHACLQLQYLASQG